MGELSRLLLIDVATVGFGVVVVAALTAGFSDAFWFKIPNWLTYPLILSGFLFHSVLPTGDGWLFALAGFAFGLLILLPFFLLGGVGAGDVKLLAGIGSWLGLHDVVAVFLVSGALAGAYSVVVMLGRGPSGGLQRSIRHPWRAISAPFTGGQRVEEVARQDSPARRQRLVPLATMIAAAILILMVGALVYQNHN